MEKQKTCYESHEQWKARWKFHKRYEFNEHEKNFANDN